MIIYMDYLPAIREETCHVPLDGNINELIVI